MVQQLIVPVDGSSDAWRGFDVAVALSRRTDSSVRVVEVQSTPEEGRDAKIRLHQDLANRDTSDVEVTVDVRLTVGSVADELALLASLHPGAVIVMSSHGKGRSAALVGSVTEDLLRATFGPVILVGPHVEPTDFSGPIVVGVDGSEESEVALALAAAWATELRATPWIVNVIEPSGGGPPAESDLFDSAYPARLAQDLHLASGHRVEFEELHDHHPGPAVADFATRRDASMIVATSHGRSGLSRLLMGSVTSSIVRHATCPVMVVRLPHPDHADDRELMWAY